MSINIVENGELKNVSGGGSAIRDGDGNIITDTYARKDHIVNSSIVTEPGFMADARLLNPNNKESPLYPTLSRGFKIFSTFESMGLAEANVESMRQILDAIGMYGIAFLPTTQILATKGITPTGAGELIIFKINISRIFILYSVTGDGITNAYCANFRYANSSDNISWAQIAYVSP